MNRIQVVAAIFQKGNRVMIARRKECKSHGLKWEFPGGKIEQGESKEEALIREIHEEFAVSIEVQSFYLTNLFSYDNFEIELHSFKVSTLEPVLESTDHDQIQWIKPQEYYNYKIAPADLAIFEKLLKD